MVKQSKGNCTSLITPLAEKPLKKTKSQIAPFNQFPMPEVKVEIKTELLVSTVENSDIRKLKNDSAESKKRPRKDSIDASCPSKKSKVDDTVPVNCVVCSKQFQNQVLYE